MRYPSILDTVGDTPIVELTKLAPPGVRLFGKVESFNPMGSVKDRLALAIIEDAEHSGALKPGQTVVEATSGNTGIGLAMVCAAKGYPLVIVMAESFSVERRRLMRYLGAQVVLTPAALKGSGMYLKAVELAEHNGWFLTRQFENEANADAHTRFTAQEILRDFNGERLDYWISTFGSGGTLRGVGRALRAARPETRIIAVEPDNAQLLGGGIPQPVAQGPGIASHPSFRPHPIQGVSPDFISKLTGDALADGHIDRIVPVSGAESIRLARELAQREGVFVGVSSGATVAAALALAKDAEPGSTMLCMLADTGERYLSTPLFDEAAADMSQAELEISRSTPSARFEAPAPAPAPSAAPIAASAGPVWDAQAEAFVDAAVGDPLQPVVMFVLEWCEFCWAVRKLFEALGVSYRPIEIDSAAMQENDLGARLRRVLSRRNGVATIPQVYVGGTYIGGCMDVFDAYREGGLQDMMAAVGFAPDAWPQVEPDSFLPNWLHAQAQSAG